MLNVDKVLLRYVKWPLSIYVKFRVAHAPGCRERFLHHRLQRKQLISDPGMHDGTCVTHVPWCMPGSLTRGGGKNVLGIPGTCASLNFTYLVRGPWRGYLRSITSLFICSTTLIASKADKVGVVIAQVSVAATKQHTGTHFTSYERPVYSPNGEAQGFHYEYSVANELR